MDMDFLKLTKHCAELEDFYVERNANNAEIDKMYFLKWTPPAKDGGEADIKITVNTAPRNAADGARQLLTAAEPIWSVARDKNSGKVADKLETAMKTIWYMCGRIRQKPLESDAVGLGIRRDEIHIGVALTATMLENAAGSSPSNLKRLEQIKKQTPVMFEIYDPSTGYPEYDSAGLVGYFRKTSVKAGRVLDAWGDAAREGGVKDDQRWEDITYCEWFDYEIRAVWIEGQNKPIYYGEHGLPCIPIVCQTLNGSPMSGKTSDEQVQSFLYGVMKSGKWKSANLYATIADTNALAFASNPTFIQRLQNPEQAPQVDYSIPGGVLRLFTNETQEPMVKSAIDPAILTQAQRIDSQMEEDTMYKVSLGQPLGGGNAPFSSVALLNQIGRQPLISMQKMAGWAFARAMETAFLMLKADGKQTKISGRGEMVNIKPADIPDGLVIDCKLDVNLPTDDRQNAMVAAQLVQANLTDREWAREEILGIGQSGEMDKRIYFQKRMDAIMDMRLRMQAQQLTGLLQQAAQPPTQQTQLPQSPIGDGLSAMPMIEPTNPENMPPGIGPGPEAAMTGEMPL